MSVVVLFAENEFVYFLSTPQTYEIFRIFYNYFVLFLICNR